MLGKEAICRVSGSLRFVCVSAVTTSQYKLANLKTGEHQLEKEFLRDVRIVQGRLPWLIVGLYSVAFCWILEISSCSGGGNLKRMLLDIVAWMPQDLKSKTNALPVMMCFR
jgi:hypothetical protein